MQTWSRDLDGYLWRRLLAEVVRVVDPEGRPRRRLGRPRSSSRYLVIVLSIDRDQLLGALSIVRHFKFGHRDDARISEFVATSDRCMQSKEVEEDLE